MMDAQPLPTAAAPSSSAVCDPHLNGISLQDMIDTDIKAEFDDVLRRNPLGFSNLDSLDLFNDLDSTESLFKFDVAPLGGTSAGPSVATQVHTWGEGGQAAAEVEGEVEGGFRTTLSAAAPFGGNSYLEDLGGGASAMMVNPNNVMPVVTSAATTAQQQQQQQQQPQPVQHQQVQRLSVNTQFSPSSHGGAQQGSPQQEMGLASPGFVVGQVPPQLSQVYNVQVLSGVQRPSKTLKVLPPASSPMQQVPGSPGLPATAATTKTSNSSRKKNPSAGSKTSEKENGFPKPAYSYSCLIALALKNSMTGSMTVSEIYKFMCEHFPYFKTAPSGWKNSVRHNLSLNKCFEKIEKPVTNNPNQRKGCLWTMNPAKITKMDEEVKKWSRKDPMAIKKGMIYPHTLESLERGEMVKDYNANSTSAPVNGAESEDEEDPRTPTSVSSNQGYDFVDVEAFTPIPDSALPELNLQAPGSFHELKDGGGGGSLVLVNGSGGAISKGCGYPAAAAAGAIQGNYTIAPAAVGAPGGGGGGGGNNTFVIQKKEGQTVYSVQ